MKANRFFTMILRSGIIFLIPLLLLTWNIWYVTFDRGYYAAEFDKYKIMQNVGIEKSELISSNDKLLEYLKGKRPDLDFKAVVKGREQEFFSSRDKIHMIDVKNIYTKLNGMRIVLPLVILALIIFIVINLKVKGRTIIKDMRYAALVGVLPVLALVVLMNTDFYKYFTIFHQIFFTSDLWLLDPAADRLVNIFPESFFYDMALRICKLYLIELAVLFGFSVVYTNTKGHRR